MAPSNLPPTILDDDRRTLCCLTEVHVRRQDWCILALLAKKPGHRVSKERILHELFWDRVDGGPLWAMTVIRLAVSRLRRQLKECGSPAHIITIPTAGYLLEPSGSVVSIIGC